MATSELERFSDEVNLETRHLVIERNAAREVIAARGVACLARQARPSRWIDDFVAQAIERDRIASGDNNCTLERRLELADVTRPAIVLESTKNFRRQLVCY